MIIEFPKRELSEQQKGDLLREYAFMSEAFTHQQFKSFWREQETMNTDMWRAFGPIMTA